MGGYRIINLNQTSRLTTTEKAVSQLNYDNFKTYYHGWAFLFVSFSLLAVYLAFRLAIKVYTQIRTEARFLPPQQIQLMEEGEKVVSSLDGRIQRRVDKLKMAHQFGINYIAQTGSSTHYINQPINLPQMSIGENDDKMMEKFLEIMKENQLIEFEFQQQCQLVAKRMMAEYLRLKRITQINNTNLSTPTTESTLYPKEMQKELKTHLYQHIMNTCTKYPTAT